MTTRSITRVLVFCMAATLALAIAGSHQARADLGIITLSPDLPPTTSTTGTPGYVNSLPKEYSGQGYDVVLSNLVHTGFNAISSVPDGNGNTIENFQSKLYGDASINGGSPESFMLAGPMQIEVFNYAPGDTGGPFTTQMLSMDLTGNVSGTPVEIKLDPNNATMGSTTITDISGNGTLFHITSYFDVFTEISINGGAPIAQSDGAVRMTLTAVPEPSTRVVVAIAATVGMVYAGSRRRHAT